MRRVPPPPGQVSLHSPPELGSTLEPKLEFSLLNNFNFKSDNDIKLEIITPLTHLLWILYGEEINPEKKKIFPKLEEILRFVLKI